MVLPVEPVTVKRGVAAGTPLKLKVNIRPGYHCNTNTPSDEYLIPLKLTFAPGGPVEVSNIVYPKGKDEKYSFSAKPLNVYSGSFEITAAIKAGASAAKGQSTVTGKLRYQACNDSMCFAPKTLEVQVPVVVTD